MWVKSKERVRKEEGAKGLHDFSEKDDVKSIKELFSGSIKKQKFLAFLLLHANGAFLVTHFSSFLLFCFLNFFCVQFT